MSAATLTLADAARMMRDATKDKSYRAYPLGQEAARYLRASRKRLTTATYRDYESCLDKLARNFTDLQVGDFEPPVGTERLEEFLDALWGDAAPRTYNKNHSVLAEFFRFERMRGELNGDPMLHIGRAKARGVHRTVFSPDQRLAIFAANAGQPDITVLRLLLTYGLRKGAVQAVRFEHLDFARRELTIFTKGGVVQTIPIPDPAFWSGLDVYMREIEAHPKHYLMCRRHKFPTSFDENRKATGFTVRFKPNKPLGVHGFHDWWYRCLARADVVPKGTTSGERIHKARHTAGQRVLDHTGNLKAVQKLLGHKDIQTTGNIYTDWDIDQLRETLAGMDDE